MMSPLPFTTRQSISRHDAPSGSAPDSHEPESHLFTAIEGLPIGIVVLNRDRRLVGCNTAMAAMIGYTPDELIGKSVADITHPEDVSAGMGLLQAAHQGDRPNFALEKRYLHHNGSIVWARVNAAPITADRESPRYFIAVIENITARKRAESARRDADCRFRNLIGHGIFGYCETDGDGVIRFLNERLAEILQVDSTSLLDSGFADLFLAADAPDAERNLRDAADRPETTFHEWRALRSDGNTIYLACHSAPLIDEGVAVGVQTIVLDVTAQKTAHQHVQHERDILRGLIEVHERDRRVLAYDIHDGFAQQLTGLLFQLQAAVGRIDPDDREAHQVIEQSITTVRESIDETRRLINGLRPPILDESGIGAAIEHLVYDVTEKSEDQFGRPVTIEFGHDLLPRRLAPPLESAMFRIVQEALTNACRHSETETVRIDLRVEGERIHLSVRDWGVGFEPATVEEGRFGLQGIQERARLLGGKADIETAPGEGTIVDVQLPLLWLEQ